MLRLAGAVLLPIGLVRYEHPDSFLTFVRLVVGGICGALARGLLLFYALPVAIALALVGSLLRVRGAVAAHLVWRDPAPCKRISSAGEEPGEKLETKIRPHKFLGHLLPNQHAKRPCPRMWDVFISHASEDKATVARPLALLLQKRGVAVWLDEGELYLGAIYATRSSRPCAVAVRRRHSQ